MGKKNRQEQFSDHMETLIGASEARSLMQALDRVSPKSVRYNRKLCTPSRLEGTTVPWCTPYGRYWGGEVFPSRTMAYAAGKYYIQEASAMLAIAAASRIIDFSSKIVLDLTAAPGGKATQAAELIETGYLVANEVIRKRVDALVWNINRHRLNNVIVTALPTELLAGSLAGFFDVVVVDAPCSGEGLFQRKKHSPLKWSEKNVRFCARRQHSILTDACRLVKPGGNLVYSTCTFSQEENEDQVQFLLNSGFEPVPLPDPDDLPVSPAISDNEAIISCSRRIFPHRENGAGAFVCVVRKREDSTAASFSQWKYVHPKPGTVKTGALPFLRAPHPDDAQGFFYEKNGVISYFSHHRIPAVIRENAFQTGAPLYDKRRASEPMFGAIQLASNESIIQLEEKEAIDYIRGLELHLNHADGHYWVARNNMVLGPVKISSGRAVNKLPRPMRVV
jgi:16S rRNA C967 or C1407 C5-methylase (RsmB/RsmF family)